MTAVIVDFRTARRRSCAHRDPPSPAAPITLAAMENLYHDFGEWPAFLPFALWYGNLAARLRRGEQPTAADTRLRDELITRLRCALPGAAP